MAATPASKLPVALFGYDSSLFTQKARLALRLKQVRYTYIVVPSMMPRPLLRNYFNITYRKIPILAIGREIYLDTSLICEALDSYFPAANGYGDLHPKTNEGASVRALSRVFASYYSDRPLFRAVCGLMPPDVWRSGFGTDRAGLIGHKLDADKLEKKVPECLSLVDLHLSLLEEMLAGRKGVGEWVLGTVKPSLADLALYAQLDWGRDISEGKGVADLSAGEVEEGTSIGEGMKEVFNAERFPKTSLWYLNAKKWFGELPLRETKVEKGDKEGLEEFVKRYREFGLESEVPLLETPVPRYRELDERNGLKEGATVSIAPDDTGRWDPSIGKLIGISPQEVVIQPDDVGENAAEMGEVRLHFPRIGFVVRPVKQAKL